MILKALKKCWSSCFSERVMRHRLDNGMPTTGLRMAVIIQVRSHCILSYLLQNYISIVLQVNFVMGF